METTKTGAIICKRFDAEKEFIYEALMFITEIPHDVNDAQLQNHIDINKFNLASAECHEILYRADIHSSSNEVQEQFAHLHKNEKPIPELIFYQVLNKNHL